MGYPYVLPLFFKGENIRYVIVTTRLSALYEIHYLITLIQTLAYGLQEQYAYIFLINICFNEFRSYGSEMVVNEFCYYCNTMVNYVFCHYGNSVVVNELSYYGNSLLLINSVTIATQLLLMSFAIMVTRASS